MKLETIAAGILSASILAANIGEIQVNSEFSSQDNESSNSQKIEQESIEYDHALKVMRNFLNIEGGTSTLTLYEKIANNPSETIELLNGLDIPGNTSPERKLFTIRLIDEKSGKKCDHWTMQLVIDKTIEGEDIANLAIAIDKNFNYFDGNENKLTGKIPAHVLGTISNFAFNIPEEMKNINPDRVLRDENEEIIAFEKSYIDTSGNLYIQSHNGYIISFQAPYPIPEEFNYKNILVSPVLGPKPKTA